uniref:LITAF domain-containing protein n=1 Tax=Meloidogyne javanica TaxID=6303 RepID=A0A915M9F0_MELJA
MGNGYSHYYGYPGYNPFMPYGQPYYGGYTLPAQFYGPDPQLVYCPTCKQNQTTKLKYVAGKGSWSCCIVSAILGGLFGFLGIIWLIEAINEPEDDTTTTAPYTVKRKGSRAARIAFYSTFTCFCFGICCGCMFSSFCCDWSKDVKHYCSACDTYIGTHLRDHRRPVIAILFLSKQILLLIMVYVHVQTYGYAQYFGPKPQLVHCPTCNQNTKTKLKYVVRSDAWLGCICIALMGVLACLFSILYIVNFITKGENISLIIPLVFFLVFGLSVIAFSPAPFYWNYYKDIEHYCNMCDTYIGKHVRDIRRPIVILPPESYKNLPTRR